MCFKAYKTIQHNCKRIKSRRKTKHFCQIMKAKNHYLTTKKIIQSQKPLLVRYNKILLKDIYFLKKVHVVKLKS